MGARKHRTFSRELLEDLRARIKTGMVIDTLHRIADGEIDATTARLKACEILLRKTLPDLTSVEIAANPENIRYMWAKPEQPTVINGQAKEITGGGEGDIRAEIPAPENQPEPAGKV